jgi:hypothetical protein
MELCYEGQPVPWWFRSRDRRVLDAHARWQAAADCYTARVAEILTAAQAGAPLTAVFGGSGEFAGLTAPGAGILPPGWRVDGSLAVPDPSQPAGRWVTAAIATAWHPGELRQSLPGLPPAVTEPEVLPGWRAKLLERGAALCVGWPPGDVQGRCVGWPDPRLWEPAAGRAEARPAVAASGKTGS